MNGTKYEVPYCGAFSAPHSHPSWAQMLIVLKIWAVKTDKSSTLGSFIGNPRVKQISSDPTKVSKVGKLFFRENFVETSCEETNSYFFIKIK